MTKDTVRPALALAKETFSFDREGVKELFRAALQDVLEAQMSQALGAAKGERTEQRLGYRSG